MSLCQSLRQYVFVHAALIEGALMIVDEEREASEKESPLGTGSSVINGGTGRNTAISTDAVSQISRTPSKRGPSPTELLKKDKDLAALRSREDFQKLIEQIERQPNP